MKKCFFKLYKIIFLSLFLITLLNSCRFIKKADDNSNTNYRDLVIIDNSICKIVKDTFYFDDSLLYGKWQDTKTWILKDTGWIRVKFIDYSLELNFYPSHKFVLNEIHSNTIPNKIVQGEFWTFNSNDSIFLICAYNINGDTLFKQGDSMSANPYFLYSINDTVIKIRSCSPNKDNFENEIIQLNKK